MKDFRSSNGPCRYSLRFSGARFIASCTAALSLSCRETLRLCSARRRAKLAPIAPAPMIPIYMLLVASAGKDIEISKSPS